MMLQVEGLTKKFGGLTAVNEVDFSVEKGTVAAIIGPNGAGKSTFFNLLSGFHPPTSGRIVLNGRDVTGLPPHEMARLGMARTFQTTHLFTDATVLENVMVGHRLRTRSSLWDALFRTGRLRQEER
ncbi:MAG: ATP-binding cassette domain-containing protein, partial [Alicyclobacillaceae bacterium]|nr:ATP-binding cassette domain-containing protein [Alicyclobacillaceae bacterium]